MSLQSMEIVLKFTGYVIINIKKIAATHNDIPTATAQLQGYLNTLQTWFNMNQLKVAPTKSTIILLTNYTKELRHTSQLTLDNTAIPHKHPTKSLVSPTTFHQAPRTTYTTSTKNAHTDSTSSAH